MKYFIKDEPKRLKFIYWRKQIVPKTTGWFLFPWLVALVISIPIVIFFSIPIYSETDTWKGIIIEAHGMIFDIIVIGIIVSIVTNLAEKRNKVQSYIEQISDYAGWESQEASLRIAGIIRRLNSLKKSKHLTLIECWLKNAQLRFVELPEAIIIGSNLKDSDLQGTNLQKSTIGVSNFENSNLMDVDFSNTNIIDVNFKNANLDSVNLRNAKAELYQFKHVKTLFNAIMPDGSMFDDEWKKKIQESILPEVYSKRWGIYF